MRAPPATLLVLFLLAGCLQAPAPGMGEVMGGGPDLSPWWVHGGSDLVKDPRIVVSTLPALQQVHVGASASEPSMGVTHQGHLFFTGNAVALPAILRSVDGGKTWQSVAAPPLTMPTGLDAFLHVDPVTDRVFVDSLWIGCSYLSWSDNFGNSWTPNPLACGNTLNDHQKITTGKFRPGLPNLGLYPSVVYFGYNQLFGNPAIGASRISVSLDGGLTWPINSQSIPDNVCSEGLHGRIRTDSDGIVYIPKRDCDGTMVAISEDNARTWRHVKFGQDVGSAEFRKNHEMAIDSASNLYMVWPGKDNRLYLAVSVDRGRTWSPSILASPPNVTTTTMPSMVAGSDGRIAIAYYGVVDGNGKNPECVGNEETWDVLVTWSLDALAEHPTFVTTRANPVDDPVQIGGISTLGLQVPDRDLGPDCKYRRNLADFIDMIMDYEGRVYVGTTDGCMGCKDQASSTASQGTVGIQVAGPSLFVDRPDFTAPPVGVAK